MDRAREAAYTAEAAGELIKATADRVLELLGGAAGERTNAEVIDEALDQWTEAKRAQEEGRSEVRGAGLRLPWKRLDEMMVGLETGVTLVAGRPSAGKSTFEGCIAEFTAARGVGVARVALDDPMEIVLQRLLAKKGEVSLPKLKFGFARENQLQAVREGGEVIKGYPMWITDRERDIRGICTWIRAMKARHDIGLLRWTTFSR